MIRPHLSTRGAYASSPLEYGAKNATPTSAATISEETNRDPPVDRNALVQQRQ
jgi:hypothetical protein